MMPPKHQEGIEARRGVRSGRYVAARTLPVVPSRIVLTEFRHSRIMLNLGLGAFIKLRIVSKSLRICSRSVELLSSPIAGSSLSTKEEMPLISALNS